MRCDPTSFANSNQVKTQKLSIDWTINFETKTLKGFVEITLKVLEESVSDVVRYRHIGNINLMGLVNCSLLLTLQLLRIFKNLKDN